MRVFITLLALAPSATAMLSAQQNQNRGEVQRVEATANALMAADNVRDVEQVIAVYAADAVLMPPNETPVSGHAAIRPRYTEFFRTHAPSLGFVIEETVVVQDLAYVRGRTRGTIRGLGGNADQTINDVFLMILRRQEGNVWKISRLMWHPVSTGGA